MAFIPAAAAMAPELAAMAEPFMASLIGGEGLSGLKKFANIATSMFSKRNKSPSHLLDSIMKKGKAVIQDPAKMRHVLEKGGHALDVATGSGKHLAGALHSYGILSEGRARRFATSTDKINHGFHRSLARLGKIHGDLLPFLKK